MLKPRPFLRQRRTSTRTRKRIKVWRRDLFRQGTFDRLVSSDRSAQIETLHSLVPLFGPCLFIVEFRLGYGSKWLRTKSVQTIDGFPASSSDWVLPAMGTVRRFALHR